MILGHTLDHPLFDKAHLLAHTAVLMLLTLSFMCPTV